jgi:hypothetical protein
MSNTSTVLVLVRPAGDLLARFTKAVRGQSPEQALIAYMERRARKGRNKKLPALKRRSKN